MVLNTEWAQVEVIDLINDGSGLAFGIIGGRSTGVVVKTILPGGVADRDGRLQSGDHILQIGEVNLRGLGSEQVASVLRQCGVHVRMVVARPIESAKSDYQTLVSQAPIVPTKILGDPVELDRHLIANGYAEAFAYNPSPSNFNDNPYIYSGHQSQIQLNRQRLSNMVVNRDPLSAPYFSADVQNNFSTMPMLSLELGNESSELPETETFTVELKKDDLGLGITVAGYVCEKEEISGIFVKSISKGSAADLTNSIRVNDRIVEVDGTSVIGYTNHQAVELLRNSGPVVTIQFERYLRGPKFEQLQQAILANEMRLPSSSSPTLTSLLKVPLSQVQMDYLSIDADGESRTSFEFDSAILLETMSPVNEEKEIVIGGEKRFLQFTLDNYDSIYAKWRKKLEDNAEVVIAQLQKDSNSGLGISLEGTVDVEDGREVRPHHYIRNILPEGPVGKNGILQSGDELLEVNGVQLLGLNHLEVVSILKQLPNYVSLVCARYPSSIRIIDTSQHREAFQARKILAGSLQTLIPLEETTNHLVKSKSETSIGSSVATEPTRSKSLEIIVGIPMWSDEPTVIELIKGDRGLGFSILDYQDPLSPQETVIVVRSLVPGGVAYADGRLIPGDRLLAVNGINIEHATLNVAVQVLKWVPKGTVTLTVAKPLNMNDTVSHTSQDTEEDQTGLEDFQECIEEFQECLDVVHICIEAENSSFSHSPTMSHMEEILPSTKTLPNNSPSFTETNCLLLNAKNLADSDIDVSFKSISDAENIDKAKNVVKTGTFAKTDSLTQSDRPSDGYETCLDESLSEDNRHAKISKQMQQQCETESYFEAKIVQNSNTKTVGLTSTPYDIDDLTPTNSRVNILTDHFFHEVPDSSGQNYKPTVNVAVSEPCLSTDYYPYRRHICLEMKLNTDYTDEDGLKSYDNQSGDFEAEDEFFLVQYPRRDSIQDSCKSKSDPNVLENYRDSCIQTPLKKCLKEYYNDFSECLEAFSLVSERKTELCCDGVKNEMCDDDIFNEILLPFKSQSTPDIADSSFVMLTYDPGPDLNRRKSAAVPSCKIGESEMTVIRPHETDLGGCQIEDMLQKHWGSTHTVKVYREPNKSLGISIVGGKVDLHSTEKTPDRTLLGIFVKHVVPNSPAGKTGQFKTGDRILEVSGIDLKQATHEKAVQAIRNASNPVTFVIQSLIPWKITNDDSNKQNQCQSPYPSPVSSKSPPTTNFNNRNEDEKAAHENHQKETLTPNLITPNAMGLNTKNLSPIVTQTTPMHSPKRSQSALSESVLSPSPTSDLEVEKISHRGIESGEGSEDEDEDEEDVRELEGRTVTDKGQMIDRASAGNVKRTKDEIAADLEEEDEFGYTTSKSQQFHLVY